MSGVSPVFFSQLRDFQVTPAMHEYVEKKLGKVFGKHILENSIKKVMYGLKLACSLS